MGLFRRDKSPPPLTKEGRIMRAMWEISAENGGTFVASVDIAIRLQEDARSLGLSDVLQRFEDSGLIEHHRFPDGTGGDRPTSEGLARFGLQ